MLRSLYDWCIRAAEKPYATWLMGVISFLESSVFPIPPDTMLIPMSLARPDRAWFYAHVCTVTSVAGGVLGYAVGALLYDSVGHWLIQLYGYGDKVDAFRAAYAQWGAWIILLKGLTPIPYKIVTITSGFAGYNFWMFVGLSFIARGIRFYLLAFLLHRYGPQARAIIEERLGFWVSLGAVRPRARHRGCAILVLRRGLNGHRIPPSRLGQIRPGYRHAQIVDQDLTFDSGALAAAAVCSCLLADAAGAVCRRRRMPRRRRLHAPAPAAAANARPARSDRPLVRPGRSNFRDHLRGAKRKMDDLSDDAAANSKGFSDKAAKVGQGAAEVGKSAADATKNAVDAVAKLPTARMMSGRERCAIAPNGAPDCVAAAESALPQARLRHRQEHGFHLGRGMPDQDLAGPDAGSAPP